MQVSQGILTVHGGLVSHAAVVARGWGIPAIVGAEGVKLADDHFTAGDATVREGDVISLDGATGHVVLGELALAAAEPPEELRTLLSWADRLRRGKMAVRANADTGPDAAAARRFGAEGIGLRSEEHTSELQSPMRHSYAVLCLEKKHTKLYKHEQTPNQTNQHQKIITIQPKVTEDTQVPLRTPLTIQRLYTQLKK